MLSKSKNILYFFNFDGPLFGESNWYGSWYNSKVALIGGPKYNPSSKDVRWHIFSNRHTIHKPFMWMCCWIYGLYPKTVLTIPNGIKGKKEILNYKLATFRRILIGNDDQFRNVEKIFYIDTDLDSITFLNSNRKPFSFMGVYIKDFNEESFNILL